MQPSDNSDMRQREILDIMTRLTGNIAHDLNNLLSPIIGYADLSAESIDDPQELKTYLRQIIEAGKRAQQYSRQLLHCSGRDAQPRQAVDIEAESRTYLAQLKASLPHNIELFTDLQLTHTPRLLAAPDHLYHLLHQLCDNAVRAMHDGGRLSVSIQCPGDGELHICIEDSGRGMSPATLQRAFEPYFSDYDKHAGTGMGLAMVHGISRNLGGRIEIKSSLGAGSRISIHIPLGDSTPQPAKAKPAHIESKPRSPRVLLLDDDKLILQLNLRALKKRQFNVEAIHNPELALQHLLANPEQFDLLVTDQSMPSLTGLELTRQLRLNDHSIPVIICSGHGGLLPNTEAQQLGIRAFITKPVTPDELADNVVSALEPQAMA